MSIEEIEESVVSAIDSTLMVSFMPNKVALEIRAALRHVGYNVDPSRLHSLETVEVVEADLTQQSPVLKVGQGSLFKA